jgi:AraC-like DNA-binding protein
MESVEALSKRSAAPERRCGSSVAELAVECGFYDQAHLANEFRSFSGIDLTTYTAMSQREDYIYTE